MKFNEERYLVEKGSMMDLIKRVEDESIDCLVTDPPYSTISGGTPDNSEVKRPTGILSKNDGKIFKENDLPIELWIHEVYRVMKNESHIYIMTNFKNLENYLKVIQNAGFELHNLLIWVKNNVTPNRWYMKNVEYIIFGRKGSAKPINNLGTKTTLQVKNLTSSEKIHPTEKPVELLKILIENSTKEGEIVFDPFAGSFSTIYAAVTSGRKSIGFELDPDYYEAGLKRVSSITEDDIKIPKVKKKKLTEKQKIILEVLKENPEKDFNGKELAALTGLSPRTCSGCITPLYSAGLVIKTKKTSPLRIKIK